MAATNYFAIIMIATSCASCSANLDPIDIDVGSTTRQRPETTVGPAVKDLDTEWRIVRITLPSSQIREAASFSSTVHLTISDCAGVTVAIDDIYISNFSLNEISKASPDKYRKLTDSSDSVSATFYIKEDIFQREGNICGSISGGGMAIGKTGGIQFIVK